MSKSKNSVKLVMVTLFVAIFFGTVLTGAVTAQSLEDELRSGTIGIEELYNALIARGLSPEDAANTVTSSAINVGMQVSDIAEQVITAALSSAAANGMDLDDTTRAVSMGIVNGTVNGAMNMGVDAQQAVNDAAAGIGTGIQAAAQAMELNQNQQDQLKEVALQAVSNSTSRANLNTEQAVGALNAAPAPMEVKKAVTTTTGAETETTFSFPERTTTTTTTTTTQYGG